MGMTISRGEGKVVPLHIM